MKFMKKVTPQSASFAAITMLALSFAVTPARAASTDELVDLCAAAMDAQMIAKAEEYRVKLKKIRGGGLKRLTLDVVPLQGDKEGMTVECRVKGGNVVDLIIK